MRNDFRNGVDETCGLADAVGVRSDGGLQVRQFEMTAKVDNLENDSNSYLPVELLSGPEGSARSERESNCGQRDEREIQEASRRTRHE